MLSSSKLLQGALVEDLQAPQTLLDLLPQVLQGVLAGSDPSFTSRITSISELISARKLDSRPRPIPLTRTRTERTPLSAAFPAAFSAASCPANGDFFRLPLCARTDAGAHTREHAREQHKHAGARHHGCVCGAKSKGVLWGCLLLDSVESCAHR